MLRDRGCAFLSAGQVHGDGTRYALEVDAFMLIEAFVLRRDGAVENILAYFVDCDRLAVFEVQFRKYGGAVVCEDRGLFRELERVGIVDVGEIVRP